MNSGKRRVRKWWIVFWPATYANVPVALRQSVDESGALRSARQQTTYGDMAITSDRLFAQYVAGDQLAAEQEYARLLAAAMARQTDVLSAA